MVNPFSWLPSNRQLRLPVSSQFIITSGRPRFLFSLELFSSLPFIANTRNAGAARVRNPLEEYLALCCWGCPSAGQKSRSHIPSPTIC